MNYKYKIDDKEIILSEEEDEIVSENIKTGKSLIYLRNGSLLINVNFIRYRLKTDSLTDIQEEEKRRNPRLSDMTEKTARETREKSQGFIKLSHNDYYARMGWKHEDNCVCKTTNF